MDPPPAPSGRLRCGPGSARPGQGRDREGQQRGTPRGFHGERTSTESISPLMILFFFFLIYTFPRNTFFSSPLGM